MFRVAFERLLPSPERGRNGFQPSSRIMDLSAQLQAIFPLAEVRVGDRGLTVCEQGGGGYSVTIELVDDSAVVCFGPGLVEFDDLELAFKYAVLACSKEARLHVLKNGTKVRKWRLELQKRCGTWHRVFAGGFSLIGGRKTGHPDEEVVLRNRRSFPAPSSPAYDLLPGPAATEVLI